MLIFLCILGYLILTLVTAVLSKRLMNTINNVDLGDADYVFASFFGIMWPIVLPAILMFLIIKKIDKCIG